MISKETIESNQKALAVAIQSIAYANAMSIAAIAALLDKQGVMPADKFGEMMLGLAGMVETSTRDDDAVGAEMLRKVHDIIRAQNPPKWKPTVVG